MQRQAKRLAPYAVAVIALLILLIPAWLACHRDEQPRPEPTSRDEVWAGRSVEPLPVYTPPAATQGAPAWVHTCVGGPDDFNCPDPSVDVSPCVWWRTAAMPTPYVGPTCETDNKG
ncbi:hypothetical protein [Streptomyces sp. NBC_00470]|uniref:hypothetical protein n=1 Tax=Streptomyces sp. NBC_00470 TaxID=2975753 RepID=UPI0030E16D74